MKPSQNPDSGAPCLKHDAQKPQHLWQVSARLSADVYTALVAAGLVDKTTGLLTRDPRQFDWRQGVCLPGACRLFDWSLTGGKVRV